MHASAQVTACCMRHVAWASQFFNPVSSEASGFLYMRPREPAAAYLHARAAAPGQARGSRRGGRLIYVDRTVDFRRLYFFIFSNIFVVFKKRLKKIKKFKINFWSAKKIKKFEKKFWRAKKHFKGNWRATEKNFKKKLATTKIFQRKNLEGCTKTN